MQITGEVSIRNQEMLARQRPGLVLVERGGTHYLRKLDGWGREHLASVVLQNRNLSPDVRDELFGTAVVYTYGPGASGEDGSVFCITRLTATDGSHAQMKVTSNMGYPHDQEQQIQLGWRSGMVSAEDLSHVDYPASTPDVALLEAHRRRIAYSGKYAVEPLLDRGSGLYVHLATLVPTLQYDQESV